MRAVATFLITFTSPVQRAPVASLRSAGVVDHDDASSVQRRPEPVQVGRGGWRRAEEVLDGLADLLEEPLMDPSGGEDDDDAADRVADVEERVPGGTRYEQVVASSGHHGFVAGPELVGPLDHVETSAAGLRRGPVELVTAPG